MSGLLGHAGTQLGYADVMSATGSAVTTTSGAPRLRDTVVSSILDLTREMGLRPGQTLPTERDLATRLGVSRNVIRQSFDILEERGLILSRRGSGRYLRAVTETAESVDPDALEIASIADILETRAILEVQVAAMACQRRTTAELEQLVRLASTLTSWQDNVDFHVAVAAATHNFMLERLVRQQIELSADLHQREKYSDAGQLERMRDEHMAIVRAIGSRDEATARDLMRHHLSRTRQTVEHSADSTSGTDQTT